jgi:NNP family nitrate/nitrite transporter-like MFS transporter
VIIPLLWGWLGGRSINEIMALGLLLGVAGGSFAIALPLVSRCYPPRHQGLAMGIVGAGNSGTVLAALIAPRLAEVVGWHNVFGLAIIPIVITLILYIFFVKESPSQPRPKPLKAYLEICREKDILWFCLLYSFTFGGFIGVASFLVIFFHDQYALSKVRAGAFTALCVLGGSLIRPLGGYLADCFGGIKCLKILFVCASLGLISVGMMPPLWLVTILLFFVMVCLGMGNGSVFQLVPQRFRQEIGVATGVVGAAGGLGGFLLPSFLGLTKELTGFYGVGFLCFGITGFLYAIFLCFIQREWKVSGLNIRIVSIPIPSTCLSGRQVCLR